MTSKTWYLNPHVARLQRQPGCLSHHTTWLPCMVVISLYANCAVLCALVVPGFGLLVVAQALTLTLPLLMVAPVFLSIMATTLTATDAGSRNFDLLLITPMTDWQLVWGYFYVVLWRARTFLTALIGLQFIMAISATIALTIIPRDISNASNILNRDDYNYQALVLMLAWTFALQTVGLCLLVVAMAIAAVMLLRDIVGLRVLLPALAMLLVLSASVATLLLFESRPRLSWLFYGQALLLAGLPYLLTGLMLRLATRWVRRPMAL